MSSLRRMFLGTTAGTEKSPCGHTRSRRRDLRHGSRAVAAEDDSRYKMLFSHPLFVQRLLESFVQEPFTAGLDYSTLERVNASFVGEEFARRLLARGESVTEVASITELSQERVREIQHEENT